MLLAVAFLAATACSAPAMGGELTRASLERLVTLSGMPERATQIPRLLRIGLEQARAREEAIHNPPSMSDSEYAELETTVLDAFKPAGLLKAVAASVSRAISEEDAEKMLAWYDSQLGRRIEKAEAAADPEGYRGTASDARTLLADAPRVRFAKRLDALQHITDAAMRVQLNTAVAMFVVFSTKNNLHRPANPRALKHRLAAGLERTRAKMARAVMLSTLYTYRHIDMPSLTRYLGFLASSRVVRFNRALRSGMDAGMNRAMDTMSRTVTTLLKKQHLQTI